MKSSTFELGLTFMDHLHSYAKQPNWRTSSEFRCPTDGKIYGNSFVYKYFSSSRGICVNASGLFTLLHNKLLRTQTAMMASRVELSMLE